MAALSAHYMVISGEFTIRIDGHDNNYMDNEPVSYKELLRGYMRTLSEIFFSEVADGALYLQWKHWRDYKVPFSPDSYQNMANFQFNDIFMTNDF